MLLVVGSGPAGVSCAQGLLSTGAEVTMLEPGLTLDAPRLEKIAHLRQAPPESWEPESLAFLKETLGVGASGIRLKLAYGSDHPYRAVPGSTRVICEGADTKPSYARGGLSTVWGSCVLPYRDRDLAGWPMRAADLGGGYRAVLQWMPISARRDDLESMFPIYRDSPSALPISRQAEALLADLRASAPALASQGVRFGLSRLAVSANGSSPGCVQCGLCMYGCPHELIYSSDTTVRDLLSHPRFRYKSGITVRSVAESQNGVKIAAVDALGRALQMEADRVFLGAGVLETTAILLRSLGRYDTVVSLKDSPYFLLPLLRRKGTCAVASERLHTLAQAFVEIEDEAISPYTIHLQTYTYNELFREPVVQKLGSAKSMFPLNAFLGRLLLFQGYLHSNHAHEIQVVLKKTADGEVLNVVGRPSEETRAAIRRLVRKLFGLAGKTGLYPLFPMLQVGKPGRGFHSGGTFPMSESPGETTTDIYGRPSGLRRIHAVDSTIFPSVPATTITFTVMANAWRIGSQLEQYA